MPDDTARVRDRAAKKIAHMMRRGEDRPRAQIVAIGIKLAREGKVGPRGGYTPKG